MPTKKIILPGGSGFLGRTLAKYLATRGWDIVVLSRSESDISGARTLLWNGKSPGLWTDELEGATAVVNLAGRSVNCRYNAANRRAILESRIDSTRVLGETIAAAAEPPAVWINSSTATIYKHNYELPHDEAGEIAPHPDAKDAFSIEVAQAWEAEFQRHETPSTRKALMRTALVLGRESGGPYATLRRIAKLGLGGRAGHGRQFVSWIHALDFCRAVEWIVEKPEARGIYNVVAPNCMTNEKFMRELRRAVRMPIGLPAARWMLEAGAIVMGTETELIVKSRRVYPHRLMNEKFVFQYPMLEDALAQLEHPSRF